MYLQMTARRTVLGMCAHVAAGRKPEASELMRLYLEDAAEMRVPKDKALMMLVQSAVGAAVALSHEHCGSEWFTVMAEQFAGQP